MHIYHLTKHSDWDQALSAGFYSAPSLAQEGFIHTSTLEQVADTANRYYRGQSGMCLLVIDVDRVQPEVRFEAVVHHGVTLHYPHIYGPLNLDAVTQVLDYVPDEQGNFHPPSQIS